MDECEIIEFVKDCEIEYKKEYETGNFFNVFKELGLSSNEVRHSQYVKALITPYGNHGMGVKLYLKFLERVLKIEILDKKNNWLLDYQNIRVIDEYFIGNRNHKESEVKKDKNYGRIDLLIENCKEGKAVIIENKIYAKDQDEQISRYCEFANSKYGTIGVDYLVYYLTLDEKSPSDKSLKDVMLKDVNCISYQNQILNWLEDIQDSLNPQIKTTANQYLNLIRSLTNQSMNLNSNLLIEKHPELLKHISAETIIQVRDELRKQFFVQLKKSLQEKLGDISVNYVESVHTPITDEQLNEKLKPGKHVKNFGLRIGTGRRSFNIEAQQYQRLIYGVVDPDSNNEFHKKLRSLSGFHFEEDRIWLKEVHIIGNHEQFYSDELNYKLSMKMDEIVEELVVKISSIYKAVFTENPVEA